MVSEKDENTAFEARAKAVFDESVAGLDGHTLSRLTQARHAAVEALAQKRNPWQRHWLMPAAGFATAAFVAVMIVLNVKPDNSEQQFAAVVEDMELLSDAEDIELLEDMEFYAWLESQPDPSEEVPTAPATKS